MTPSLSGWLRSTRHLLSPGGIPATRIALERDAALRGNRLVGEATDRARQRVRPTRPKMRALVVTPGGRMHWRSVATPPPPGPKGAVVRPLAIATCDMDRPIALGATPFPMPLRFGHECVAEVLSVGGAVRDFAPGDRVVVPFQISCGECDPCRAGRTANCASVPPISMYGFGLAGGHWGGAVSDELAVPFADGMLVALPEGIDPAAAASVADNVSDAHRHIAPHLPGLIAEGRGREVLIVGAMSRRHDFTASVSMYVGQVAKALGAETVTLVDAREVVRREASALGLDTVDPADWDGPLTALVVNTSAVPRGLRFALDNVAPDGVCSCVGGLHASAKIPISVMYGRNVSLHVSRCHARTEIPEVLGLMADGRLRPQDVTTLVAAMDEAPAALDEHFRGLSTKTIITAE